jgi:hypothetical protein
MIMNKNLNAEDLEDLGLYLRGLLQIMAADKNLHIKQQERIKSFAKDIGFEEEYIERNIQTVLQNKYIPKTPGKFHSKTTAVAFLIEAAGIAVCDGMLHPLEKKWLMEAAEINDLDINIIMDTLTSVPLIDSESV